MPTGELSLADSPVLTREMLRDLIDVRIAVVAGREEKAEAAFERVADRIRVQGKPQHTVDAYRETFMRRPWVGQDAEEERDREHG